MEICIETKYGIGGSTGSSHLHAVMQNNITNDMNSKFYSLPIVKEIPSLAKRALYLVRT